MRTWKPLNTSRDGLIERASHWSSTPKEVQRFDVNRTNVEESALKEVQSTERVDWKPELGRRVECSTVIAGVHDDLDPCTIHLFFKAHTQAVRALNVLADQAIADIIIDVLDRRYPKNAYKVEYYGQYQKLLDIDLLDLKSKVSSNCMCLVLNEGPFNSTPKYRDETVRLIDAALGDLKE